MQQTMDPKMAPDQQKVKRIDPSLALRRFRLLREEVLWDLADATSQVGRHPYAFLWVASIKLRIQSIDRIITALGG
jgi:hypothetical protein